MEDSTLLLLHALSLIHLYLDPGEVFQKWLFCVWVGKLMNWKCDGLSPLLKLQPAVHLEKILSSTLLPTSSVSEVLLKNFNTQL